jgi:hypothetical protein
MTTAALGEVAVARCEDCRQARAAGYQGVTGWHTGDDGERHNHLRGRASPGGVVLHRGDESWMRAYRASESLAATIRATRPAPAPELTPEELAIAQAMGLDTPDYRQRMVALKRQEAGPSIDTLSLPRSPLEAARRVRDQYFPGISDEALRETLEREREGGR